MQHLANALASQTHHSLADNAPSDARSVLEHLRQPPAPQKHVSIVTLAGYAHDKAIIQRHTFKCQCPPQSQASG